MLALKRSLYRTLLRLHPAPFRNRFAREMALDFEDALATYGFARLLADAARSLARQLAAPVFAPQRDQAPISSHPLLAGQYATLESEPLTPFELLRGSLLFLALIWLLGLAMNAPGRRVSIDNLPVASAMHSGGFGSGSNGPAQPGPGGDRIDTTPGHQIGVTSAQQSSIRTHRGPRKAAAATVSWRAFLQRCAIVSAIVWLTSFLVRRSRNTGIKGAIVALGLVAVLISAAILPIHTPPLIHAQVATQSRAAKSSVPTIAFDVSSVKENRSDSNQQAFGFPPNSDRFTATNAYLLPIIQLAFGLPPTPMNASRVVGAPGWLESARYDIEAKVAEADVPKLQGLNPEQQMLLLRPLLADRFKLQAHIETRDFPEYALVIAKNGSKLTEAKPGDMYANGLKSNGQSIGPGAVRDLSGDLAAQAISAGVLAQIIHSKVGLPVVDRTGLSGEYDIHLTYAPRSGTDPTADSGDSVQASIFTAVQEQLGLKLEPIKGPMKVLVIDHIERPSEN